MLKCQSTQQVLCSVTLPLPPSVNKSYKNIPCIRYDGVQSSRRAATRELQSFKQHAMLVLNQQRKRIAWDVIEQIKGSKKHIPLGMNIFFYFSTLWLRDRDGGLKAVQDIIFQYIGLDDRLVVDGPVKKYVDRDNPRVEVDLYLTGETW